MTVESTTNKVIVQGDSSTTAFSYSFIIPATTDVLMTLTTASGAQTTISSNLYSITGIGDANGGTFSYPLSGSAMAAGVSLTLQRVVPYTQEVELSNQGGYYPDVVEGMGDTIVYQTQQLAEQYARTIRFPAVDSASSAVGTLPAWQARANMTLGFDASGNVTVSNVLSSATAQAAAAAASATAATASATAASISASSASASATAATASASSASVSATAATASATAASVSATAATASATAASISATSGTASATAASVSATAASASATASTASATAASVSATAATASATSAAISAAAAAASASGFDMRGSCRLCANSALTGTYSNGTLGVGATFTFTATGAQTIDSVTTALGNRILVTAQSSAFQNGIYTVTLAGSGGVSEIWTRATDYDQSAEVYEGTATLIEEGTLLFGQLFIMTTSGTVTMGTTAINFTGLNAATTTKLLTARTIGGVSFDGTANITVSSATSGFAVSGGALTSATLTSLSGLTTMQNAALTTASIGALTVTGPVSLGSLVTASCAALTTASIGALTVTGPASLGSLVSASIANLTTAGIGALTVTGAMTLSAVQTLSENAAIALDPALSADGKYTGITVTGTANEALAFGQIVYFVVGTSRWGLAKANVASTSAPQLGVCVQAAAGAASATTILLSGNVRADSLYPTFTLGAAVYLSAATAGSPTSTAPTGTTDFVVRVLGFAGLTGDEFFFSPSPDYISLA